MSLPAPAPESWRPDLMAYRRWLLAAATPDTTLKLRRWQLIRFAWACGVGPADVEADDLLDYLSVPGWAPETRRSHRSALRGFYRWAAGAGRCAHDPTAILPAISVPRGVPRPAPDHVIRCAIAGAGPRERLMIGLGACAGLRCCEIARVHSDDLLGAPGFYDLVTHGKGRRERVVPLSDRLAVAVMTAARDGWAFPGHIDGHLSAKRVQEIIASTLPGPWTAHTLRHRYATAAYQRSGNLRAVQELLGHASIATTQIYTQLESGARRQVAMAAGLR